MRSIPLHHSLTARLIALLIAIPIFGALAQVSIAPVVPNSTDRVMISVPMNGAPYPGNPPPSQLVLGHTIFLTVVTNGLDWGPNPPWSQSYLIGPLAPGQYEVQFQASASANEPPYRTLTAQFEVVDVAQTQVRSAVEYFWAQRIHYFMTSDPGEMDALDAGTFPGWRRTGQ